MRHLLAFLILLLVSIFLPRQGEAAANLPPRFRLVGLEFEGLESLSPEALEQDLAGRQPPLWKFWTAGPILEPRDLEMDRLRIEQAYRNEGFYHAEVSASTRRAGAHPGPESNRNGARESALPEVAVVYHVDEGPPVLVERFELIWNRGVLPLQQRELTRVLPIQKGQRFRVADYDAAKQKAHFVLADHGFPFAEVSGRAAVDLNADRADVFLEIDTGPLSTFGPITFDQPPEGTDEAVLRRALTFQTGERWSAGKLEVSRRNLLNLNVYRSVVIERGPPPEADGGPVAVTLRLQTRQRRSLKLGVGYGTEDRLRLQAALTWRNMFQRAGRLTLSARRSSLVETLQLDYVQPYFRDARNTLDARAGLQQEDLAAYKAREAFSVMSLTRNFREHWHWKLDYGLTYTRLDELKITDPDDLRQAESDRYWLISGTTGEIVRDTRNDLLNPSEGGYLLTSMQLAPELLGSEVEYVRPVFEARFYRPLVKDWILAGRLRMETIQEIGDTERIPIFERLFLGGSYTLRGYGFQELPPLDPVTENPLGGQTAANANLELRFPIYRQLTGVMFIDAGQVDPEPFRLTPDEVRYTTGAGLRYDTVVGPLRVDFGYKLNPPTRADIGDFSDPDDEIGNRWRIHLNIGQTF